MKVQLPQNYRRVSDAFEGLPEGDKARIISHLESQPDSAALDKTVNQILHNGGQEAELVGRIFQRNVNPAAKGGVEPEGIRTVDNKKLEPIQKKDGGTGAPAPGELETEQPHTSTVNPPSTGHPGRTVNQPGSPARTMTSTDGSKVEATSPPAKPADRGPALGAGE